MRQPEGVLLTLLKRGDSLPAAPLYRQIYQRVREAILAGELLPGARLPASRRLSMENGLSRNTVELAFAQLEAEGFIVRRRGSGSYVCRTLPGQIPSRSTARKHVPAAIAAFGDPVGMAAPLPPLSPRGQAMVQAAHRAVTGSDAVLAFGAGTPAMEHFPLATWNRLTAKRTRISGGQLIGSADAAGYQPLREAIAAYLGAARGVRCRWEQVIVTTGTQQSLDLATRLLLEPGDRVWIEDPAYKDARAALEGNRLRVVPVPVDTQGLDVNAGKRLAPRARFAYVTPSHQYPLGITMSLGRRLELLRWAEGAGAWVFEDDYDSEFRYAGRPLAALQGLDTVGQVLYAGTFHKVLFPALRLAYLVVPEGLVDAFVAARGMVGGFSPPLMQAVATDFITQGHLSSHLRQMRALYRERRDALLRALASAPPLAEMLRPGPTDAGLHIAGYLPDSQDDQNISRSAHEAGLYIPALSSYYANAKSAQRGLVIHFAATPPSVITKGVQRLAERLKMFLARVHGSTVAIAPT